jgi:hypothetical protein
MIYELRYFVKFCVEEDRVIRYWKVYFPQRAKPAEIWSIMRRETKGTVEDPRCYDETGRWIKTNKRLTPGTRYTFQGPRKEGKVRWQVIQAEKAWESLRPAQEANVEVERQRTRRAFQDTMIQVNGYQYGSQTLKGHDLVQIIDKNMQRQQDLPEGGIEVDKILWVDAHFDPPDQNGTLSKMHDGSDNVWKSLGEKGRRSFSVMGRTGKMM